MREQSSVNIRAARAEDADSIARVIRDSYAGLPAQHVPADMPAFHAEHHREQLQDATLRWAVLAEQGVLAGVAVWRMLPEMAHLHLLYVASQYQQRGFGVRLLRHFEAQAAAERPGLRLLTLHCMRDSTRAVRFYQRHGYAVYHEGDERRILDLLVWLEACHKTASGLALKADKLLFYRRVGA